RHHHNHGSARHNEFYRSHSGTSSVTISNDATGRRPVTRMLNRFGGASVRAAKRGLPRTATNSRLWNWLVAVGTTIADRPPHRSVRAELPHTAPTSDGWRQIACRDRDARFGAEESISRRAVAGCPIPVSAAGSVGAILAATAGIDVPEIVPALRCFPAQRDSGNTLPRPVSAIRLRPRPAHASSGAAPA